MKCENGGSGRSVLVISASACDHSINDEVMEEVGRLLKERGIDFDPLYLRNFRDIPMLIDGTNVPDRIGEMYEIMKGRKTVVIFAPEHNGYFSAFFKNILDWISRIKVRFLEESKVIVVSVSNTGKDQRLLETGIRNSFSIFSSEPIKFVNFNKYGDRGDEEVQEMVSKIGDLIV